MRCLNYLNIFVFCLISFCLEAKVSNLDKDSASERLLSANSFLVSPLRKNNNVVFTLGMTRGLWKVAKIASSYGKDLIRSTSLESRSFFAKVTYTYLLKLFGPLKYTLGSSAAYYKDYSDSKVLVEKIDVFQLPGIHVGLVFDYLAFSLELAFEAYLETTNNFKAMNNGETTMLSVFMRSKYDFGVFIDYLYVNNWGLRIESHFRELSYIPVEGSGGTVLDSSFSLVDSWFGIGTIYNF